MEDRSHCDIRRAFEQWKLPTLLHDRQSFPKFIAPVQQSWRRYWREIYLLYLGQSIVSFRPVNFSKERARVYTYFPRALEWKKFLSGSVRRTRIQRMGILEKYLMNRATLRGSKIQRLVSFERVSFDERNVYFSFFSFFFFS